MKVLVRFDPHSEFQCIRLLSISDDGSGRTDEERLPEIIAQKVRPDTNYWVVESEDLPTDRYFRNAWQCVDGVVSVHMDTAKHIQMDRIRVMRDKELAKKDIEYMKALEADDGSSTAIAVEKQTLRDIPQTFDLTTDNDTPEELKGKWPTELPARE